MAATKQLPWCRIRHGHIPDPDVPACIAFELNWKLDRLLYRKLPSAS